MQLPLTLGLQVTYWPAGLSYTTLKEPAFWARPVDQQYAQLPFPGFWTGYKLHVFNMDDAELKRRRAAGRQSLLDIDLQAAGFQYGAGLFWPGLNDVEIAVYPTGEMSGTYTGPPRSPTEQELLKARRVIAHETGHFFESAVRMNQQRDDIQRMLYARFTDALQFLQGTNRAEKIAEGWRAACGCDETRGTFSDGKAANLPGHVIALYRCAYWLSAALAGRWVVSLVPAEGGCKYQTWVGLGWRWRWISSHDWSQLEYNGSTWEPIR